MCVCDTDTYTYMWDIYTYGNIYQLFWSEFHHQHLSIGCPHCRDVASACVWEVPGPGIPTWGAAENCRELVMTNIFYFSI